MNAIGKSKSNEHIQVYVRCRPINQRERNIHSNETVKVVPDREVVVQTTFDSKTAKKFTFDRAFGPKSSQGDVYQVVVAPLITEVLSGYNCTVFAYGQTGTGKTHTMIGDDSSYADADNMGIIPRAVKHLFEDLRLMKVEFSMRISYLELYNEELSDLLSSNDAAQIRIYDDSRKKGSVIVQGLEEIPVRSTADVFRQLEKGQEKRKMASTLMNAQSSRSHTIFSVHIHITEKTGDGEEMVKIGKLNLVDLAGSENISKAGNEKGIRTRESVSINQSLLTLGRVITALVERTPHVPYRESKLTRLLQESLGGRTKTSIIATISPGHKDIEETLSTLEYAHRAKNIQNKPEINQKIDKRVMLKEYSEEIEKLKRDLMAARDKNGIFLAEETYQQLNNEIETKNKELNEQILLLRTQKEDLKKQKDDLDVVNLTLAERTNELQMKEQMLMQTKTALERTKRGYVEKKQLILKHKQTEEVLTDQAKELIQVANTVTQDVAKLHESIARRRDYESKNQEVIRQFDGSLKNHLQNMETNLTMFGSDLESQIQSHVDQLNSNAKQSKTLLTTATLNLQTLLEFEQNGKAQIDTCVDNHKKNITESLSKQLDGNAKTLQEMIETKESFGVEMDHMHVQVKGKVNVFDIECKRIESLANEKSSIVSDFCGSMTTKMQQHTKDVLEFSQKSRQLIDQTSVENNDLLAKMCSMLDEMKGMVGQVMANNQRVQELSPALQANEIALQTHTEQCTGDVIAFGTEISNKIGQTKTTLGVCEQSMKSVDEMATEMVKKNREKDTKLVEQVTEVHEDFKRQTKDVNAQLDEMFNEIRQSSELTEINVSHCVNDLMAEFDNEQGRIDANRDQFAETQLNLDEMNREFAEKMKEDINVCAQRLQQFSEKDISFYKPSGATPAKLEYKYPQKLIEMSPHSKIIKDFWSNHDGSPLECSAIITEESQVEETLAEEMTVGNETEITERTLCENRIANENISTPFVPHAGGRKMSEMIRTSLNNNISVISGENKENN